MKSRIFAAAAGALLLSSVASAAEIKVLSTQATEQAYRELVPQFERATGHKVTTIFTGTLDADKRLAAGEVYDLLIMSGPSIEEHLKDSKLLAGSQREASRRGESLGAISDRARGCKGIYEERHATGVRSE